MVYSISMNLFLTSSGINTDFIEQKFKDFCGKDFHEMSCALVPTAAHPERGDKAWKIKNSMEVMSLNWKHIEVIDIGILPKDVFSKVVQETDVVVFGGGDPAYLVDRILEKYTHEEFTLLLDDKVYVGISAGSMAPCKYSYFKNSREFYGEESGEESEGLGWLDYCILPHYDDSELGKRICSGQDFKVYGLNDRDVVTVRDGKTTLHQESRSRIFHASPNTSSHQNKNFYKTASMVGPNPIMAADAENKSQILIVNRTDYVVEKIEMLLDQSLSDTKIGCITTAIMGMTEGDRSWLRPEHTEPLQAVGAIIEEYDITNKGEGEVRDWMNGFDIVLVTSGDTCYLLGQMRKCNFETVLKDQLSEGMVLIASSACSAALGPDIEYTLPMDDQSEEKDSDFGGFGILPFKVVPHLDHPHQAGAAQHILQEGIKRGDNMIGLLDDQVIQYCNGVYRVV